MFYIYIYILWKYTTYQNYTCIYIYVYIYIYMYVYIYMYIYNLYNTECSNLIEVRWAKYV